jgi:hypothetical protein
VVHFNGTEAQPANQPDLPQPALPPASSRLLATLGRRIRHHHRNDPMNTSENTDITRFSVFVPGSFPAHCYVRRTFKHVRTGENFDPESQIADPLQPGIIAQVVGPSKSGKTRAIENCVGEFNLITIAGSQISHSVSLWNIAQRLLRSPKSTESTRSVGNSIGGEVTVSASLEIPLVSVDGELKGSAERTNERAETQAFESDPFQDSLAVLRATGKVLFLDDFHTIPQSEQSTVAAQLKAAAQFGIRICLAEVPHHSDSTISALPDLTGRVQKIEFQYWSRDDLSEIGTLGFGKLNAVVSPATLAAFAMEAAGSPQLMQLICLNAAAHVGIDGRPAQARNVQLDVADLRAVLLKTHSTVDRERIFKILDQGPDERGNPRNRYPVYALGEGDNYEIALAAISLSPPMTSLTWNNGTDNLLKRIDRVCSDLTKRPGRAQVKRALEQMQVLAEKHMSRQPIIEWSAAGGLQILDPYFLFHLRWSAKYEAFRDPAAAA